MNSTLGSVVPLAMFIICKCLYFHLSYDYSNISSKSCVELHGITTTQIAQLEKVDNHLMRTMLSTHAKIPIEFLLIKSEITSRRLDYLKHIHMQPEHDLIKRIFSAQREDPKHCQRHNGPEGWVLLTKVTSLGLITSSYTNLDQTSSESRPSTNFKV